MTSPRGMHSTFGRDHQAVNTSTYSTSYDSTHTDLSLDSREVIVADQWLVLGKIGEGSFGEVFEGKVHSKEKGKGTNAPTFFLLQVRDIHTNQCYAIKRETAKIKRPQLHDENAMYGIIAGGEGIPRCHWYGQFDGFDCIVMDLLGPNLGQVRHNVSSMELNIAVDLACQMVSIVEHIHNRGVIVRDIKPDNFLFPANCPLPEAEMMESMDEFGMPVTTYKKSTCREVFTEQWRIDKPKIYAVDFGLACYWRDPETGKAHPDTKKHIRNKTGTARYASINVHKGRSHSRRDDVESIGYILLDLLLGTLPWTGIHAKNSKAGWDRMRQLKVDTFMSDLCAGLPQGVLEFVEYPRTLQFTDQPDYGKMRRFLQGCLPGGAYSDIVKSPFGGEAKPTDNYDIIQLELKQLQQKQLEEQRQRELNHGHYANEGNNNNDSHALFAMDDLTHQLPSSTVPETKSSSKQQRKDSTASQSSLKKLLKKNKAKKVGWNTWKHDQAPWNPKTDWTNDEDPTLSMAKSWGDDQKVGAWGASPPNERQDHSGLWDQPNDVKEAVWGSKQPSLDATSTRHQTHNVSWKKKTEDIKETNWDSKQPTWDAAQDPRRTPNGSWRKKTDNVREADWDNEQTHWNATQGLQQAQNHSWGKVDAAAGTKWAENLPQDAESTLQPTLDDSWKICGSGSIKTASAYQRTNDPSNKSDKRYGFKSESAGGWQQKGRDSISSFERANTSWRAETTGNTQQHPGTSDQKRRSWQSYPTDEAPSYQQRPQNQPGRRRHFSQPHQRNQPSSTNTRSRYGEESRDQRQYRSDSKKPGVFPPSNPTHGSINTQGDDSQVDGWQRKPGSNSWQQKR